jgi:hypothetical protein
MSAPETTPRLPGSKPRERDSKRSRRAWTLLAFEAGIGTVAAGCGPRCAPIDYEPSFLLGTGERCFEPLGTDLFRQSAGGQGPSVSHVWVSVLCGSCEPSDPFAEDTYTRLRLVRPDGVVASEIGDSSGDWDWHDHWQHLGIRFVLNEMYDDMGLPLLSFPAAATLHADVMRFGLDGSPDTVLGSGEAEVVIR